MEISTAFLFIAIIATVIAFKLHKFQTQLMKMDLKFGKIQEQMAALADAVNEGPHRTFGPSYTSVICPSGSQQLPTTANG
jgi:hypothetical protein